MIQLPAVSPQDPTQTIPTALWVNVALHMEQLEAKATALFYCFASPAALAVYVKQRQQAWNDTKDTDGNVTTPDPDRLLPTVNILGQKSISMTGATFATFAAAQLAHPDNVLALAYEQLALDPAFAVGTHV